MKKYEIEINNEVYRVSVKELSADADMSSGQSSQSVDAETPTSTEPSAQTAATGDGEKIKATMAGTHLSVNVSPGQYVTKVDILIIILVMILEYIIDSTAIF